MRLDRLAAFRHRYQRRRRLVTVAAVVFLLSGAACGCGSRGGPHSHARLRPYARVTANLNLGGAVVAAAAAGDALWVLTCTRSCSGPALGSEQLAEIAGGPRGRVVKRFRVADATALAVGEGAIWTTDFVVGTVTRVDPADGRATATIRLALPRPIAGGDRHFLPDDISAGAGAVWVSTARGWIAEIDPRTSRLVAMVASPGEETGAAVASHGAWVAEELAGVGSVGSDARRLTIHPIAESGEPVDVSALVSGGGLIWVYGSLLDPALGGQPDTGVVTAIDPRSGHIAHQLQIPGAGGSIVYDGRALYVSDFERGLLFRIDRDYAVRTFRAPPGAHTLVAATPGAPWASAGGGRLLRLAAAGP